MYSLPFVCSFYDLAIVMHPSVDLDSATKAVDIGVTDEKSEQEGKKK